MTKNSLLWDMRRLADARFQSRTKGEVYSGVHTGYSRSGVYGGVSAGHSESYGSVSFIQDGRVSLTLYNVKDPNGLKELVLAAKKSQR